MKKKELSDNKSSDVRCSFRIRTAKTPKEDPVKTLFTKKLIKGNALNRKYIPPFFDEQVPQLAIPIAVHVSNDNQRKPLVDKPMIEAMFEVANNIWSQACIKLEPYYTGVTPDFINLVVTAFINCLPVEESKKAAAYEVTIPGFPNIKVLNLFIVKQTGGSACGNPFNGRVIIPTDHSCFNPQFMGEVLAHEVGHILLNPAGVDSSSNSEHLMYHPGSGCSTGHTGLFQSDCYAARETVVDSIFYIAGQWFGDSQTTCVIKPTLGMDLVLVRAVKT